MLQLLPYLPLLLFLLVLASGLYYRASKCVAVQDSSSKQATVINVAKSVSFHQSKDRSFCTFSRKIRRRNRKFHRQMVAMNRRYQWQRA